MGSQLLLIDAVRSAAFENAPKPSQRSAEPTDRFDDYLNEAQSGESGASADELEEVSDSPDDRKVDDDESEESVDAGSGQVAQPQQTVEQIVETAVVVQTEVQSPSPQADVSTNASQNEPSSREVSNPIDLTKPSIEADQAKQTGVDTSIPTPLKAEDGAVASRDTTQVPVISKEQEAAGRVEAPVVQEHGIRQQGVESALVRSDDSQIQKNTRRVETDNVLPSDQPVIRKQEKPVEPVLQPKNGDQEHQQVVRRETVQQRKVKASIEERREGATNATNGDPNRLNAAGPNTRGANHLKLALESHDALNAVKFTALSEGQGDSAAASVARFLIAGRASTATPTVTSATTVSHVDAGSGATPVQVSPANLVGELLTARVESPDSIEGAARVLNASGRSGQFQVTMQLDPPDLGQLKLQIRMHQQGMTLQVNTETQGVARLIESRMSELRDALAAHGIRIDRADVVVRSPDSGEAEFQQQNQESPQRDAQQPKSDGHNVDSSDHEQNRMADDRGHDQESEDGTEKRAVNQDVDDIQFDGNTIVNNAPTTELSVDLVV